MNTLTVVVTSLVGAGVGYVIGAFIGEKTNTIHDDLGIGEAMAILFGGFVGSVSGAVIGAAVGSVLNG